MDRNMKCTCGGRIKKGVKGRIQELAKHDTPHHPENRPHYQYIVPLAELLSTVHNKGVTTKYVQTRYNHLLELFGNEIEVLISTSLEKIREIDPLLAQVLNAYRNNCLNVNPGRGGKFGEVEYN